ncbi:hypothetical protein [Streptomyces sp. NPDC101237]|uniref:hypothetical protein n=1 Tax=Streptomyces sp. NPDC101237 TaxID=3366139 RepID=UPI0037FFF1A9
MPRPADEETGPAGLHHSGGGPAPAYEEWPSFPHRRERPARSRRLPRRGRPARGDPGVAHAAGRERLVLAAGRGHGGGGGHHRR